jgi:tRNA(fMet)-specific endonuclease VapC
LLIDLLRGSPAAEKKLQYYTDKYEPLTTTPISAAELFKGAYGARDRRAEVTKARDVLEYLELLEMPIPVCEEYGKLVNDQRSKGSPIGDLDTLTGSTALIHRQILIIRNKTHFERIPGLEVDTW